MKYFLIGLGLGATAVLAVALISNAIEERTEIKRENITHWIKCLGFSNISSYPELDDFIVFLIDKKANVKIKKGKNISRATFD